MASKTITLTENQKRAIVPIVAGLILIGGLSYVVSFCEKETLHLRRELSLLDRKIKVIQQLEAMKKQEAAALETFPKVTKKNDVIKEIANWARLEGLQVDEIEPREAELQGTNFMKLDLTIKGLGTYLPIMRFLKRIEESGNFVLASQLHLGGFELQNQRRSKRRNKEEETLSGQEFDVTVSAFLINK